MTLIVHHLSASQSERIPFLCEELGISYNLRNYKRTPALAPDEYKALHPQGTAPIIQDGDITLCESGACMEYIAHKFGDGRLFLRPSHPAYADFIYYWHWANGTFQHAVNRVMMSRVAGMAEDHWMVTMGWDRLYGALALLNSRLADNTWLAGEEFTVADVMVMFSLTTMRYWSPYSLKGYDNLLRYVARLSARDGYQRAMRKCDLEMELVLGAEAPKAII